MHIAMRWNRRRIALLDRKAHRGHAQVPIGRALADHPDVAAPLSAATAKRMSANVKVGSVKAGVVKAGVKAAAKPSKTPPKTLAKTLARPAPSSKSVKAAGPPKKPVAVSAVTKPVEAEQKPPAKKTVVSAAPAKSPVAVPARPVAKKSGAAAAPVVATAGKNLLRPAAKGASAPLPRESRPAPPETASAVPPPATRNGKTMGKKPFAGAMPVTLPPGYRPTDAEPFMGALQRFYFRTKLLQWKDDIIVQNRETLQVLHDDTLQHSDIADRANSEAERALELRARDRQRKLVSKIDAAVARIDDGSYGFCEETGEPINLKRLDARPIATMSLEAQERHERREKVYRED